ncbi:hypothetical protein CK203_108817 [Vitis vinifera]|uniref:RNase H type-1 domain-containing protein n=1 Tax=Vitis vinifera TaxID=29760 RepID=A0A438CE05_VITVI|nr:hypothetical protein CK203_108817 [Vitis vinifera]
MTASSWIACACPCGPHIYPLTSNSLGLDHFIPVVTIANHSRGDQHFDVDWSPIIKDLYSPDLGNPLGCRGSACVEVMTTLHGSAPSLRRHAGGCVPPEGLDLCSQSGFTFLDQSRGEIGSIFREIGYGSAGDWQPADRPSIVQDETLHDSMSPPPPPPVLKCLRPHLILPAKFRMSDIERYTSIGCPRIHLQLYSTVMRAHGLDESQMITLFPLSLNVSRRELEALRQGTDEGLWIDSSPGDVKRKKPFEEIDQLMARRDLLFHIRPQDNHVMQHSSPRDLHLPIPGLEPSDFCSFCFEDAETVSQLGLDMRPIAVPLQHAIQNLIDQGLVHLGQPSVTTNPLPTHITHAVPPPADNMHSIDFVEFDDHIHMLRVEWYDSSPPQPLDPWRGRPPRRRLEERTTRFEVVAEHSDSHFHMELVSIFQPQSSIFLLDNGSALNTVRAYDSTRREVMGTLEIELLIGSAIFATVFQVLRIPASFNLLLGQPWIHRVRAIPYSLHQKVKFIHDGQVVTTLEMEDFYRDFVAMSFDQHGRTMVLDMMRSMSYIPGMGLGRRQHGPKHCRDRSIVDRVVPHEEYVNEMLAMSLSQTEETVKPGLASPFDLFGVSVIEIAEEILAAFAPEIDTEVVDFGTADQPRELRIGLDLSIDERDSLIQLLMSYLDIFAWSYEDMPDLDLSIVNIICISPCQTDLNKASPKDDFPFPHIDMLVDSTAGHSMLSFMDGFSDQITWQLWRGSLRGIRQFRLRLNPKKCTFGVTSGKLLGYMVSERGIEVDPDKIRAILDIPASRTKREVRGFLANHSGYGIGFLLISSHGDHIPISVRLAFSDQHPAMINIVEYEACILGLETTLELEIRQMEVFGDSNMVLR